MESIITDDMEHCLICGSPYVQIHHVIGGTANRKLSDKYKLVVPLCREHHTGNSGVHFDKAFDRELKRQAEWRWIEEYGTEEDFIKIFGKSYA